MSNDTPIDFDALDYLTPVIQQTQTNLERPDLTIKYEKLSKSIALFTLYGKSVDEFVPKFNDYRAIDQKSTADKVVEMIFHHVFKESAMPKFNFTINIHNKFKLKDFERDFTDVTLSKETFQLLQDEEGKFKYLKAEIDAMVLVALFPPDTPNYLSVEELGYIFTEMKMFTVPKTNPQKPLNRILQNKKLEDYFKLRYIYGVIGISNLVDSRNNDPIVKNDKRLEDMVHQHTWSLHLALMDSRVLQEFNTAPKRSDAIMEGMEKAQRKIEELLGYPRKKFKFVFISNILKVITMSQTIMTQKNTINSLKNELKEERLRNNEKNKKIKELQKEIEELLNKE